MSNKLPSPIKTVFLCCFVLYAQRSFSQYDRTSYQQYGGHSSNYYPHEHDSAITVMPKLIKTNFLYYGFLSSLNQHISFEFDKQISDELILCGQVGIINSGFSQTATANTTPAEEPTTTTSGGYFEGGVKLFFNPDYTRDGKHGYYVVEGLYLKPQFIISIFSTTSTQYQSAYVYPPPTVTNQYSYTGVAIMVNLGGQWIIAHTIAIDLYVGAGVGFSSANTSSAPFTDNYFSYLTAGQNFPLAIAGGINIGLPF